MQSDLEADPTLDAELDAISPEQMVKDLTDKNKQIAISKGRVMSSYKAWQGRPMFDAPLASPSETGDLLQNIMVDDGKKSINNVVGKLSQKEAKKKARAEKMRKRRADIREEARLKREVEQIQWENRTKLTPYRNPSEEEEE